MKTHLTLAGLVLIALVRTVCGQESEEVVIPTEISEPPYEVGNLISEQGYYIDQPDETQINFRFVNNRIRIYWLDANKLIMEPPANAATVRFTGSVKGLAYHRATPLGDDVGLGSPTIMAPPHIYNVILAVEDLNGAYTSYSFRYTADMDVPKEVEP